MSRPCDSCTDSSSVREINRELDIIREKAKQKANESVAQAVCKDDVSGYFITGAAEAINQHYRIIDIISAY